MAVHADHAVGDVEVVARAADDEDGRDAVLLPQRAHARDEGADGLLGRARVRVRVRVMG